MLMLSLFLFPCRNESLIPRRPPDFYIDDIVPSPTVAPPRGGGEEERASLIE